MNNLPVLLGGALGEAFVYGLPAIICLAIKKKSLASVIVSWTCSGLLLFFSFLGIMSHNEGEVVFNELLGFIISAAIVIFLCILVTIKYRKQKLMRKNS